MASDRQIKTVMGYRRLDNMASKPGQHRNRLVLLVALLAVVFVAPPYCTYVPFGEDRTATAFTDIPPAGDLFLGAERISALVGGGSAFYPLVDGNDALGARLELIHQAERTLDLQYFLLKPDRAGAVISAALFSAAERGVRIRFLLDDIFTTATDEQLAYLDSHENIELRLFNPLSRRSMKAMNFVFDMGRVNRRMHNKSFVADGSVAVFGGRNIAEEYFQIDTSAEFADFDMLAVGPIVSQIGAEFDLYWNDEMSVPIRAIYGTIEEDDLLKVRNNVDDLSRQALEDVYKHAVSSEYLADIINGVIEPNRTDATLINDAPEKLKVPVRKGADLRVLSNHMTDTIEATTEDVFIITPYFVPEPEDVEMYQTLAREGVRVRIVTNSLASTNHAYVHGGYAPYRKPLLEAGVEIFEVRADVPQVLGHVPPDSDVKLTMHTKAAVFDRDTVFVGSMNFDPRSIRLNTEVGAFLSGTEVAQALVQSLDEKIADYTYAVGLDESGDLIWTWSGKGAPEVLHSEPGASFLDKLVAKITQYLPVHGQL